MKSFILSFEDKKSKLERQRLELHAKSFAAAYKKGKEHEQQFIGLELKSITIK